MALGGAALAVYLMSRGGQSGPDEDPGDAHRDVVAGLLREGRLAAAEAAIDEWRTRIPGDGRLVLARAELAARQGKLAEAIDLFTSRADASPEPDRVWLRIADLHESMGNLEAAIRSSRQAIVARPGRDDPRLRLGDLLRIVGRLDEAAASLEPLLAEDPSSPGVRHALTAVRNGQGRFAEAVELIEPLLDDPGLPANARKHYAVALAELGRRAAAADVWTELLEADPFVVEGYYRLGRLARKLRRPTLARAMLERYERLSGYGERLESARKMELAGRLDLALLERAEAYAGTNQIGLAVEHYRRASQTPPTGAGASIAAILFFLRLDLLDEADQAIRSLASTPSIPPHVPDAMAGLLAEREGRTRDAATAYERALTFSPGYRAVLLALGGLRLEEGDLAAAAALIQRAHRAQADAESHILLGRVDLSGERHRQARRRFEAAEELAVRRSRRSEARLYLARSLMAGSEAEEAMRHLERAVSGSPSLAEAWESLAAVCRRLGRTARAAEAQERAATERTIQNEVAAIRRRLRGETPAERAASHLRLASLAARRNAPGRRLRYLETAVHVDPDSHEAYRQLAGAYAEPPDVFLRIRALRRLSGLRPQDAEVLGRIAETYRTIGFRPAPGSRGGEQEREKSEE